LKRQEERGHRERIAGQNVQVRRLLCGSRERNQHSELDQPRRRRQARLPGRRLAAKPLEGSSQRRGDEGRVWRNRDQQPAVRAGDAALLVRLGALREP